ncbi:MAG: hypothetical protein JW829_14385, partial [Pirellulales bacterium]|nr:hypothetical protein [Pirellulales bacterium]
GQLDSGRIVGLTSRGVYVYDPQQAEIVHTAQAPVPVRCGFSLLQNAVYFGSNAELWRYVLPTHLAATAVGGETFSSEPDWRGVSPRDEIEPVFQRTHAGLLAIRADGHAGLNGDWSSSIHLRAEMPRNRPFWPSKLEALKR